MDKYSKYPNAIFLKGDYFMNKASERIVLTVKEKNTQEYLEEYFPVVKASTLSLKDDFLKHKPESVAQRLFKRRLIRAIRSGLSDFRAQRMDPSFDESGQICYKSGMKPAVGRTVKWWKKKAKEFMPEKESRIGTTNERIAFLALFLKYLIEENGYTVSDAWRAICDQSKDLGHYWDSERPKYDFELTGSRKVGEWYDFCNTYKITVEENGTFSLFGGYFKNHGDFYPLADWCNYDIPNYDCNHDYDYEFDFSVGWIVMAA